MYLCRAAKWPYTVEEAVAAAKKLGGSVVVKAQIHAGGRGKGGGVKVAKDADEAERVAEQDPRHDAGHASDRSGRPRRAAAADRRDAAHRAELYLGIVLDRVLGKIVFMASSEGGMDIEEVAAQHAGDDPEGDDRARPRPHARSRRASWPSASAFRRPA